MSDDMAMEMTRQLDTAGRELTRGTIDAGEGWTVALRRHYDAPIEDVWSACTEGARISRWFAPISGDLRLGGTYQLEGNAGGTIVACEPPTMLRVTWVYGENPTERDVNEVLVRLTPDEGGGTVLELRHTAAVDPAMWEQFGPGAVGVGWDLGLLGLGLHLRGREVTASEREAWYVSPPAREFMIRSSAAWGDAHAAGEPDADTAAAAERTRAAYVPDLPATPPDS